MNNTMKIFSNNQFGQLRALSIDNNPWIIAKDLCQNLGLKNVSQALSSVDEEDKMSIDPNIINYDIGISNVLNEETIGMNVRTVIPEAGRGGKHLLLVNESGFYTLVLRSNKPEAKAFRKWVTSEVLPAIRKTGSYAMANTGTELSQMQHTYQGLITALRADNDYLRHKNEQIKADKKELEELYKSTDRSVEYLEFNFYKEKAELVRENSRLKGLFGKGDASVQMAVSEEKERQLDAVLAQKRIVSEQLTQIAELKAQKNAAEEACRAAKKQVKKLKKKNKKPNEKAEFTPITESCINAQSYFEPPNPNRYDPVGYDPVNETSPNFHEIVREQWGKKQEAAELLKAGLEKGSSPLIYHLYGHWMRIAVNQEMISDVQGEEEEIKLWISGADLRQAFGNSINHFLNGTENKNVNKLRTTFEWVYWCREAVFKELPERYRQTRSDYLFYEWDALNQRIERDPNIPKAKAQRRKLELFMKYVNDIRCIIEHDHKMLQDYSKTGK